MNTIDVTKARRRIGTSEVEIRSQKIAALSLKCTCPINHASYLA